MSRAWWADVAAIFLAVVLASVVEHWVLPKMPGFNATSGGGVC